MPIIKFKVQVLWTWHAVIEAVEVTRESSASVWFGDRRESRANYFDTWEAAHVALTHAREVDVANARRRLQAALDNLGNVKGMKPPAAPVATPQG